MHLYLKPFYKSVFWMSLVGLITIILDLGFPHVESFQTLLNKFYFSLIGIGAVATFLRYISNIKQLKRKAFIFDFLSILYTLWVFYLFIFVGKAFQADTILENPIWLYIAIILTFIREFSELRMEYNRNVLNPAQLFIISFLFIILIGSFLLTLPNATYSGISYLDALFTSTSAVCVTGLTVVNTASHFTLFGQTIIIILVQIGGLGILTFTSYFSYFFQGRASYENQLALSDMNSSNKLGEIFSTLKHVLIITFGIELFSGVLVYTTIDSTLFDSKYDQIFFSAFHAVSAFCNAGFSTLDGSIYNLNVRYNYYFQLVLIFTLVLGGLGFPIVENIIKYWKYGITTLLSFKKMKYTPWVLNLNSRITLITTFSITLVAFIFFYFVEYNNTLAEHNWFGKTVTALFSVTTARTAGFESINTSAIYLPTTILIIFIMWIGASPQSTGGGIKTSVFAIAVLNVVSLARGKSKIEVFRREISDFSARNAFAIILLSLLTIGLGIVLVTIFDPKLGLTAIAFECVSAYSTVGSSMGITGDLSSASKFVIIIVMFVGRIGVLRLVIALFKKVKQKNYSYSKEEITLN